MSSLLGSSAVSSGSNATGDTKSTNNSQSSKESKGIEFKASELDNVGVDSGIFETQCEEVAKSANVKHYERHSDTDISKTIFTSPLIEQNRSVRVNDCAYNKPDIQGTCEIPCESGSAKGPDKVTAHILDDSLLNMTSSARDYKQAFQCKQNSPRARLKGQLRQLNEVSRNGIRKPESKQNSLVIVREGDLDSLDECSVLVHSPGENNNLSTDVSACNSKPDITREDKLPMIFNFI